eukprot:CAMPEP_0172176712 /NCGR_PEP_ID=MMETSP1050-20130122/14985_1 /TAXON_ID=233186 /ORGANISM="Cryptomonas curvata, Strain CCAP979/52" /LENGTH=184 /DNA_ID=CAMNT_0012849055 /DNA_START=33 /DNA_END=583 /DNA_ORIENTATION=+
MEVLPDAPVWRGQARSDYIAAPAPEWIDPSLLRRAAKGGKDHVDARIDPFSENDKTRHTENAKNASAEGARAEDNSGTNSSNSNNLSGRSDVMFWPCQRHRRRGKSVDETAAAADADPGAGGDAADERYCDLSRSFTPYVWSAGWAGLGAWPTTPRELKASDASGDGRGLAAQMRASIYDGAAT